ncbi:peptide chain release factor N(5)-glutamine methyltransferase [Persicimonas caeni]|uniref:Release factor glutamine methyltransferase n=1 Tax=Persicimonas caeni TaxID=2292766 RepID=A0A4Y6PWG8_PERCE|nr:peptide chain release factor N(5)-glutamine methyltransferase [Persicimonas caeni]QDG52570.1 peptide chain release factor N(5)-glutamine methyltransferase [Persicimonas caeni]QED33792.1 peptide chain release factor N(5)-glutamine methyltransferase [Persicimonas caeni]
MPQDPATTPPEELGPPWTLLKILRWTTHFFETKDASDSPRLDAELLLAHVLGFDRVKLYTHFDRPMGSDELASYRALIKRRVSGEPVAYLLGTKGFWDIELDVDKRALIPRPETEVLIEEALELVGKEDEATLVDVGTGTGAIALVMAKERPNLRVIATDVSEDALALARQNAEKLELDERVDFAHGDLLSGVAPEVLPVDIVVSNPPYVAEDERDEVMVDVKDYEPDGALFAGPDGLDVIRRLIPQAFDALASGGHFVCEHGWRQGDAMRELLEEAGFVDVHIRKDYSGHDRIARARKP